MENRLTQALRMTMGPVAIILTDAKPERATQFLPGRRGCVIAMLNAAAQGRTAVFDRHTFGCLGGGTGLGFGNTYERFPGGIANFLSTGCEIMPEGEGYKKTPELAQTFIDALPVTEIPTTYLVFKPLAQVNSSETPPSVVVCYANPDQLTALVVLANYDRPGNDNVIIPFGAGCHTAFLLPYHEAQQPRPRAVVGMTDITVRPLLPPNILTFAVPWQRWCEMNDNVPGSFLERHDWQKVAARL